MDGRWILSSFEAADCDCWWCLIVSILERGLPVVELVPPPAAAAAADAFEALDDAIGANVTRPFESVVRECSSCAAPGFEVDVEPLALFAGERDDDRLICEADGLGPERGECCSG